MWKNPNACVCHGTKTLVFKNNLFKKGKRKTNPLPFLPLPEFSPNNHFTLIQLSPPHSTL